MVVEGKHGRFRVNPHDTVIAASLQRYGEFAEHELMLLGTFIESGQTVIDVGANIGTHTIFFSKCVGEHGSVVAIEAQPNIYELLRENINLNDRQNVSALNAAAGTAAGFLTAPRLDYERDGNFGAFSFRLQDIGKYLPVAATGEEIRVEVVPLDSLDLKHCDLIKVDAEGMERDILLGAARTIDTHRPILYVENNINRHSPSRMPFLACCRCFVPRASRLYDFRCCLG
ncbi:MAG: FkbM family methyltransferase, partial [Rhodospirillaceae bacterium]|nr:FkbM family methyltransferase [Rhodospirillaceae bacterium]